MVLTIVTPERIVFSEEVSQATMMTESGEITVLEHHIPLVTNLKAGEIRYQKNGQEFALAISGGFAEIKADNTIAILADTAEHANEIDLVRANAALEKAKKLMTSEEKLDAAEFAQLQASLDRAFNRIKIGNKYRDLSSRSS